ncbi:hypothetical protein LCGC14_0340950 [marine sediment metagenome]|uniref:Glycosyltransferase subfamily 4-like N-terminal domain-containing protein n=1 Tax=marine sediment metagenome TaxID=412755 RepID=A0A0F9WL85_9ZZZZ
MNILFVCEIDFVRKVVFELQTLPELLSLKGHNVYAIDYESMWVRESIMDFGTLRTKTYRVRRVYSDAVVRLIRPGFVKIPVFSRVSVFFTHYIQIEKTIKERKIDVIILYSVPTNGLQVISIASKLGIPVVFRSIDTLNQLVSNKLLSKLTYILEKWVYSRVDLILTISPKLSEYVVKLGASKGRVRILPLGVDDRYFCPDIDTAILRAKWGISENDKIIVFVGTLPLFAGLDRFLWEFPYVLEHVPNAKMLIVGDGELRYRLESIIKMKGLRDSVIITGIQPHATVPQYINMADVCINTFPVSGATKDAYPTKIIQYMACGKPVVSTPLLGLRSMIKGEEQGIVYGGIKDVITLLKSDDRRRQIGQNALNYAMKTHGYSNIVKQLESILRGK